MHTSLALLLSRASSLPASPPQGERRRERFPGTRRWYPSALLGLPCGPPGILLPDSGVCLPPASGWGVQGGGTNISLAILLSRYSQPEAAGDFCGALSTLKAGAPVQRGCGEADPAPRCGRDLDKPAGWGWRAETQGRVPLQTGGFRLEDLLLPAGTRPQDRKRAPGSLAVRAHLLPGSHAPSPAFSHAPLAATQTAHRVCGIHRRPVVHSDVDTKQG